MSTKAEDAAARASKGAAGEEQPAMRSVTVSIPKLTPLPGPKLFGKPTGIALPNPFGGGESLSTGRKSSFTVAQEWCGTAPATWDVKAEDLELVPMDFPLERTHREISGDASEVAKRISQSLQRLSIDAQYDNENAKAKCKTMECVKFRIRLYAGGENGQPVVVECQRRSGSTPCFLRSCRAVFDAAEGVNENDKNRNVAGPPASTSIASMECLKSATIANEPSPDDKAKAAFDAATALCKSGKHDAVALGLQSLVNLTDPLKGTPATAVRVSKWILSANDSAAIRDDLSSVLLLKVEEEDLSGLFEIQKHHSIISFANALEMCANDGALARFVDEDSWFVDVLVPVLLGAVKDSATSASNAYAAARGLYSLMSSSGTLHRCFAEMEGIAVLQQSHEYGVANHDLLASETMRCLKLLES